MKQYIIDIAGMTCDHCVSKVRDVLNKDSGVASATVELSPGRARIELRDDGPGIATAIQAVSAAGYAVTGFRETSESSHS